MKVTSVKQRWWSSFIKYVHLDGDKREQIDKEVFEPYAGYGQKRGPKEIWYRLVSGRGWSFLDSEAMGEYHRAMNNAKCKIVTPRHQAVRIVYRRQGEKIFVVDQPRLPLFSTLIHHHGKQRAAVDEDFKCMRCGKEVPAEVKALAMAEQLDTIKV